MHNETHGHHRKNEAGRRAMLFAKPNHCIGATAKRPPTPTPTTPHHTTASARRHGRGTLTLPAKLNLVRWRYGLPPRLLQRQLLHLWFPPLRCAASAAGAAGAAATTTTAAAATAAAPAPATTATAATAATATGGVTFSVVVPRHVDVHAAR